MFNNLIKRNSGRTTTKILATLLVITLTFANFALMFKSIAIDLQEQDSNTNSPAVKFNAYLDLNDTTAKEANADINKQDLNLYITVAVEGNGKLEKGIIDFSDSNFYLKEDEQIFTKEIEPIFANNKITIELPIVARKNSDFNLSLLNMVSKIKLTGEYIDENGTVTNIDSTKEIKINWESKELSEEDLIVSQEVITNKIYEIEGKNKRVVQVLVKANIQDNKFPVEKTTIEVQNPIEGLEPEKVKVTTYNTSATNGNDSIEFNKNEGSSWNYNKDENKTVIELTNGVNDDGKISWQKNATDELIVTYIYEENAEIKLFSSDVKVLAKLYANENEIEKENNLTLETIEEKGNIVDIKNSITRNIYKGYMYIGGDTEYKTKNDIYVSFAMGEKVQVIDARDIVNTENVATFYKSTQINKTQALDILGSEGTIKIYNSENTNMPVSEIQLSQENNEENFLINYAEDVDSIIIETSKPLKEGKLEIINTKVIRVLELEKIEEATTLNVHTKVQTIDSENKELASSMQTGTVNLVEPETSIDILLDKTSISNQVENELKITSILNTNSNSNKLFDNPTINIELPQEITEATLENISLLYEDELKIKKSEVITNESGNRVVALQLEGKQTKYNTSEAQMGANIVMDLKVKANPFMASKNVELKATCINNEQIAEKTTNLEMASKNGLVTKNSITIGENKVEEINNSVTATIGVNSNIKIEETIINNNGKKISDIVLNGKIPEGTVLNGELIANLNNASISYAEKENPTEEDWKNTIEDYTKVKAFKLEIEELEQASNFEIIYNLQPIENALKEKDYFESQVNINYLLDEKNEQEEIMFKVINAIKDEESDIQQTDNLIIKVTPKITLETLHEGQIVTYKIELINIGPDILKNIKLDYLVPEGATYTEFTYSQGIDIEYTDNEELKNKEWNIDTIEPNQTIEKEVTIRIKKGTEQIVNNVIVKNENNEILGQIVTAAKKVEKGDLEVKLSRRDNFESTLEGKSKIQYIVIIKNNSGETKNNVLVTSKVPEETNYYPESEENNGWIYENKINQLKYTIDSIKPGEQKEVGFEVEVKVDNKNCERIIENIAQITTEDNKKYETNIYRSIVLSAQWEINMTSEHGQTIKEGEPVKYIIKVKNIGKRVSSVSVENVLPEEIQFRKLTYYIDSQNKVEDTLARTNINVIHSLDIGEILTIEIEGVTFNLEDDVQSKEIKNVAKINLGDGEYLESEVITSTIINEDYIAPELPEEPENPEQPEEPQEPEQPGESENPNNPEEPNDPENPTEPEKTYSISGLVWLDENKNGARDNNEKVLQGIQVILLDKDGNIVKDEKGNSINTITTITGTYKFNKLKEGEYIVIFEYDTNKYSVTKYQVQTVVQNQNSDAISKELTIDNKNMIVGATNVIKVQNNKIENIDIGLVVNAKFDLNLEKYIERIIVTDNKESVNYTFEEAKLAKIEIDAKKLAKSSILIQYKIKVSNEGDIQGYVGDVIDYLPKELEFNSEMNPDWYLDSNGKLHNVALEKEAIEPGKSKTLNLVLTKTLNNNSTGTITNNAEIAKSSNLQSINDIDSIVANNKQGEDDQGEASLIISIKTGSVAMYIGIVILSLAVLSIGIYLINKKVIRGQI